MIRTAGRLALALSYCLSFLAGYVDALGFIALGGYFVSFMSGNSTRLGIGISGLERLPMLLPAAIVVLFVSGVVIGTVIGHYAQKSRAAILLFFISGLLLAGALLHESALDSAAIILMTLAMGAANTAFDKNKEVRTGVTYMTGNLVKAGQRLAAAFLDGAPVIESLRYIGLWASLVAGAAAGAALYVGAGLGLGALWVAGVFALILGLFARKDPAL